MKNKPIKNKFYTEHDDGSITFNGNLIVSDTPRTDEILQVAGMLKTITVEQIKELERENAALKQALDAQADYQRELRTDRDRLDWLCMTDHWFDVPCDSNWKPESFRAAIDSAMGVKP